MDYSSASATLWLHGRNGGSAFKAPSFLLLCLKQVSEQTTKAKHLYLTNPAVISVASLGFIFNSRSHVYVFSPTCLRMTSSETFSPLRVGSMAPRMISRRLRPVAAENCLAWREGSSFVYLKQTRKHRQPVNLKDLFLT